MNPGQFNYPLCYLCLCGAVLSSLSLRNGLWVREQQSFVFLKKMCYWIQWKHLGKTQVIRVNEKMICSPSPHTSYAIMKDLCLFVEKCIFLNTYLSARGHWYPCFGLLVMSALGFKVMVDLACILSCLHATPQIHLWCNTCRPLDGQYGGLSRSLHASAEVGRRGSNGGSFCHFWIGPFGLKFKTFWK